MQLWFIKLTFQFNNFLEIDPLHPYTNIIEVKIKKIIKYIININNKLNIFKKN